MRIHKIIFCIINVCELYINVCSRHRPESNSVTIKSKINACFFCDFAAKKIKKIRENELQTENCVKSFQEIHVTLNKTKEQYHNLCIEFDKQKRLLDPQQLAQYQQQISSTNLLALTSTSNSVIGGVIGSSNPASSSPQIPGLLIQGTSGNAQQNVNSANAAATTAGDRLSSLASSISVSKV